MHLIVNPQQTFLVPFPDTDTIEQRHLAVSRFLAESGINRPLKVLIATNCISCGGEEHQAMRLIPELGKLGIEAEHLYYSPPHTLAEKYTEHGIQSIFVDKAKLGKLGFIKKLVKTLRSNQYDIVHAFAGTTTVYIRVAAVLAGTKRIFAGSRNRVGPQGTPSVILNSLLNVRTAAWIVNSSTNAEGLEKLKFMKNQPVYVLPNALDMTDDYQQVAEMDSELKKWIGDRKIIAAAGRLCAVKNYDLFIDSAKQIHAMNPDTCFLIIGGADCREEGILFEQRLTERIEKEKLSSYVKMTGRMERLERFYPHIDVFVSTSKMEGCPNVVLEAMRASKPVVMTRSCATSEFIYEGENGYVVDVDDSVGLAQRVDDLLLSEQQRKRFGQKSLEIVKEKFSSMNAAWMLAGIYLTELNRSKKSIG